MKYQKNCRIRIQGGSYHGQTGIVKAYDAIDKDYIIVKLDENTWDMAVPIRRIQPE